MKAQASVIAIAFVFMLTFGFSMTEANAAYIRGTHVQLKKKPQHQAERIVKLEKGEEVVVLEEQGFWRKIKVRGMEGWITRMSLVDSKLMGKVSAFKPKTTPKQRRNIRNRQAVATVGVKGLRESQIQRIKENYDMKALEIMESFTVDEETATRFIVEYNE